MTACTESNFNNPELFIEHYHKRSNVESTNAAIKRKFGETLKSNNQVAQVNELFAKIIAYNLTVIIHAKCMRMGSHRISYRTLTINETMYEVFHPTTSSLFTSPLYVLITKYICHLFKIFISGWSRLIYLTERHFL